MTSRLSQICLPGFWLVCMYRWMQITHMMSNWIVIVCFPGRNICDAWNHDDVIKWKHFPRYWPFVRGIHRFPVNSPHKGQWRRALMFSLICVCINAWVNNREAGDLRRYRAHFDVAVNAGPHLQCIDITSGCHGVTDAISMAAANKYYGSARY